MWMAICCWGILSIITLRAVKNLSIELPRAQRFATGEARYSVVIKDGNCYLVDGMGKSAVAESGSTSA